MPAQFGVRHIKPISNAKLIQNRELRIITNSPIFIPRRILHDELKIDSIPQTIRKLSSSFYNSLSNHPNPTINCLDRPINLDLRRNHPNSAQITPNLF
ncbi:hypothetical protein NPIL_19241 [Nephila pilipes]|uniref:Uncharacterized protein n=1 Tax=Nephila pilipes TaxID=299642 RepID=A0A8X6QM25_NEPPI|nr:hypothetical protein NPIL_19241 [Nephila pilipes]